MTEPVTLKECEKHGCNYLAPVDESHSERPFCPLCYHEWERARAVRQAEAERAQLRERLAALCHEQWSGWMAHLFMYGEYNDDGSFTIAADKVQRWHRQLETDYADLSEPEQDSDRKEADRFLQLIGERGQ